MYMSNNSNDDEWQEEASASPPQPIITNNNANNNANNNHVLDPYIAQAISFRESSIEEAAPVAIVDIDSTSQCQCWFRKRQRLLLVGAVLVIIGVTLASIGISLVAKKRRTSSTKHNDTVVDYSSLVNEVGHNNNNNNNNATEYNPTSSPIEIRPTITTIEPSQSPSIQRAPIITHTPTPPQSNNANAPLTFYAMGDVPYSDMEQCLIPYELAKLSRSKGKFLVHLGDIQDGREEDCSESLHEGIARMFESSPVPTFFVIGDNGWLDCGEGTADESFTHWGKHLLPFNERTDLEWPALGANVVRHPNHPEFFSFVLDNVLFLGQGLPVPQSHNMPPPEEWNTYLEANINWTKQHFQSNANTNMRAAVIFSHSSGGPVQPYFDNLKEIATLHKDVPILFLEDNHWFEEGVYPDIPNFYRLALDDTITPVSITIDTTTTTTDTAAAGSDDDNSAILRDGRNNGDVTVTDVFRYNRRCWCSAGHRPTKLIDYSDDNGAECRGICDTNQFCVGENVCGTGDATC